MRTGCIVYTTKSTILLCRLDGEINTIGNFSMRSHLHLFSTGHGLAPWHRGSVLGVKEYSQKTLGSVLELVDLGLKFYLIFIYINILYLSELQYMVKLCRSLSLFFLFFTSPLCPLSMFCMLQHVSKWTDFPTNLSHNFSNYGFHSC